MLNDIAMANIYPNLLNWALNKDLLGSRMCFIAGPRQIGKTTLLQNYLAARKTPHAYFNWDTAQVRAAYRANVDFFVDKNPQLLKGNLQPIVFDEIHKYPQWKSILKGYYDSWKDKVRFIVTGSARLDFMRRSGDSLVGRYYLFKKLPLHPRECLAKQTPNPEKPTNFLNALLETTSSKVWESTLETLFALNGFPEPFLSGSQKNLTRWQIEHLSLLVTEDLSDLTKIEKILKVEELAESLRHRTGSTISRNNIAGDLKVSFQTVSRWIDALELVYLTFQISPYTHKLARSINKESKIYFWDWSLVKNEGAKFENMVAVYLMRAIAVWNEQGYGKFKLYFVRTRDGVEVDFLITDHEKPYLLIETKLSDTTLSNNLIKVKNWLNLPFAFQLVKQAGVKTYKREPNIVISSLGDFLTLTT